jgi:hypothetical protein
MSQRAEVLLDRAHQRLAELQSIIAARTGDA